MNVLDNPRLSLLSLASQMTSVFPNPGIYTENMWENLSGFVSFHFELVGCYLREVSIVAFEQMLGGGKAELFIHVSGAFRR